MSVSQVLVRIVSFFGIVLFSSSCVVEDKKVLTSYYLEICNGEDEDGDGKIDEELADRSNENALCVAGKYLVSCSETSTCPDLDFVQINGGSFMMGSDHNDDEQPIHMVTVESFEMMRTEVTIGQYRTCVDAGVCSSLRTCSDCNWSSSPADKEDHPANAITWYQAMEFAAWVGVRLPTEAEWEYAARGEGRDVVYPWGNDSANRDYAVYGNEGGTLPVCSKPAGNTPQGLCDLAGNTWEFVQDEYHNSYNNAPTDGSGWCTGVCPVNASDSNYNASNNALRVLRGGGWYLDSSSLRVATRYGYSPDYDYYSSGVRFARSFP